MAGQPNGAAAVRVAGALAVVVVFLQTGVISEVPVFGVAIDLDATGGSALRGPAVRLAGGRHRGLRDRAAGRSHAGADARPDIADLHGDRLCGGTAARAARPARGATPLLVGAAAAATSMVGYSVMEIALGVDAPVSLELLRQIVVGVALDTIVALPVWALVHRWLAPTLPEDPRRRRRRAYTTGGLSPLSKA